MDNKTSEGKGNKIISLDSKKLDFLENFIQQNMKILNEEKKILGEKNKSSPFQCKFCLKKFACSPSVSRHKKVCPLNENAKKGKALVCHLCNNTFSRTDGLKVHMKRCSDATLKRYKNCLYQNCDVKFYHKQALMQHLTNSHEQIFQKEIQKVFPSEEAFYSWKEKTEESTFSYFSKKNGKKANIQYFYCQQDGESKGAKRKTNRKNAKGQIRTGKTCIACMKVTKLQNNAVSVKFQPMHCHILKPEDLKHHPLSKDTYESIHEQLSMGLSPKQIIKSLESKSVDDDMTSKKNDFLTVHRIQGIARLRRVKLRADPDDFVSLTKLVQRFLEEPNNPVILFKPLKGEELVGPDEIHEFGVSPDLFLLGIQTVDQQKVFADKAGEILSINVAHGTNKYDYPLLTIMVPDEYHRGFPVAHFLSNQMDVNSLICFFAAIKKNNPNVEVKCIITNDDPVLTEAIEAVFGDQFRHILCLWHVNLTFQNYLNNLVAQDQRGEMFSLINLLISSSSEEWFLNMLDNFINAYRETAPEFTETFEKYRETADKWAMAYRNFPHADIDTVLLNEAFHNRLKATCAKKKANWRIDDLVTLLIEIEQDDIESRSKESIVGLPFGLDDTSNQRHEKGLEISNKDVTEQFTNQWTVLSQTSRDKKYFVSKCREVCEYDNCPYTCKSLMCYKLCVHLYFCTCTDKSPLCKHIHKVHSQLTKIISIPADEFASSSLNLQEENMIYEESIVEAVAVTDETQDIEPSVAIFDSDLISLQPIDELNSETSRSETEVYDEEANIEDHETTLQEENETNLILVEENIEIQTEASEEILVEEIVITENDADFQIDLTVDEANSIKLRIERNISKLTDVLHQSNVSESFLNHAHMSLQNLLQAVENHEI